MSLTLVGGWFCIAGMASSLIGIALALDFKSGFGAHMFAIGIVSAIGGAACLILLVLR